MRRRQRGGGAGRPPAQRGRGHLPLVGLAEALYGAAPPVVLVGVGAGSLDGGDRLSDAVERALPEVVEAILAVVGGSPRSLRR